MLTCLVWTNVTLMGHMGWWVSAATYNIFGTLIFWDMSDMFCLKSRDQRNYVWIITQLGFVGPTVIPIVEGWYCCSAICFLTNPVINTMICIFIRKESSSKYWGMCHDNARFTMWWHLLHPAWTKVWDFLASLQCIEPPNPKNTCLLFKRHWKGRHS